MGDADPNKDFGIIQCLNNSNFYNKRKNLWEKFVFSFIGGVNYHLEHHLFPTMAHSHFPDISQIVKATCKEFGTPYLSFDSLTDVI